MASRFEYWATRAGEPLFREHGDTATHKAASTGVETSITALVSESFEDEELEHAQIVVRESDVAIARGDYVTYDGRKWRVLTVVVAEDGFYELDAVRATEVN